MMKVWTMICAMLFVSMVSMAQMPKNDDKDFEYKGEASVRRAGSGDLQRRLAHWANEYYKDAMSVQVLVDDTTERYVVVKVQESLVESYFGVNVQHKNRVLSYQIKFDAERKDYNYKVNDFMYKATEIGRKGVETPLDGKLSELKTAANKSLEEEIHMKMEDTIKSFKEAAEKELEE